MNLAALGNMLHPDWPLIVWSREGAERQGRAFRISASSFVKGEAVINIDDLTIGEARKLAALFSQSTQNGTSPHPTVGRYCVIRSYAAGVHAGIVASVSDSLSGREVRLTDTRRIWSWTGALSCTEIAQVGISGGKVSVAASENFINQAIEILPMSQEAEKCLRNFK